MLANGHGVVVVSICEFGIELCFEITLGEIQKSVTARCSEFRVELCLEVFLEEICKSVVLDLGLTVWGLFCPLWNLFAELGPEFLFGHVLTFAVVGSRSILDEIEIMRNGVTNFIAVVCADDSSPKGFLSSVLFSDINIVVDYQRARGIVE